jgi:hypothetical protein
MPETDYMMDEDLDQEAPAEPAVEEESPVAEESEDNEGVALLNKSLFPNAKPGDRLTVEVTHLYEEELAVKPFKEAPAPESDEALEPEAEMENDMME